MPTLRIDQHHSIALELVRSGGSTTYGAEARDVPSLPVDGADEVGGRGRLRAAEVDLESGGIGEALAGNTASGQPQERQHDPRGDDGRHYLSTAGRPAPAKSPGRERRRNDSFFTCGKGLNTGELVRIEVKRIGRDRRRFFLSFAAIPLARRRRGIVIERC